MKEVYTRKGREAMSMREKKRRAEKTAIQRRKGALYLSGGLRGGGG